jgi:hypothetical protein
VAIEGGVADTGLVKTFLATSRMRSRLRSASARGLRAGGGGEIFFFDMPNRQEV